MESLQLSVSGFGSAGLPIVRWSRLGIPLWLLCLTFALCPNGARTAPATPEPPPPSTPREFFNAGTQELRDGKLREAEASLETALASQNSSLQPPALYNLGWVRFVQGAE